MTQHVSGRYLSTCTQQAYARLESYTYHGSACYGSAYHGSACYGYAYHGYAYHGSACYGHACYGYTYDGYAYHGYTCTQACARLDSSRFASLT